MIVAIIERKRTCFSSPDWITIPFEIEPKTVRDELVDLLLQFPPLLEKADLAKSFAAQGSTTEHGQLEQDIQTLEDALTKWHEKLMSAYPDCWDLEKRLSSVPGEGSATITPQETLNAHTIVMYWTGCLMLAGISEMSFQMLDVFGQQMMGTRSSRYDADHCATAIAHALGRFLQPDFGTHMAQMTLFSLSVCLLYFSASGNLGHPAMLHLNGLFANLAAAGLPLRAYLGTAAPKVVEGPKLGFMDFRL